MSERDHAPLSAACVRALNDKLYEKRKTAALEIEKLGRLLEGLEEDDEIVDRKESAEEETSTYSTAIQMIKDFASVNNTIQIKKVLRVLGEDFALSQNPNSRKGGLIGLAAVAIALGKETSMYIDELVRPILSSFSDCDGRVRYHACEALYNISKVARGSVLVFFNNIFDSLSKLSADPDQSVRTACELMDRLMKDIVTESSSFDMVAFLPLLRERVFTKNTFARQFIVSWISVLDAVPDIDMLVFLPEILDGMFQILEDKKIEIKKMCENILNEFLKAIINHNSNAETYKVDCAAMINILIIHSQSMDELLQFTAITWIKEFVHLSGRTMLPFTSGILMSVLPCMAYDDENRKNILFAIRETAKVVNSSLMQLITDEDDTDSSEFVCAKSDDQGEESVDYTEKTEVQFDIQPVIEVLKKNVIHKSTATRIAALRWIYHLHTKIPNKIFNQIEAIFPILLKTLSDSCDEVVLLDLQVLSEISASPAGKNITLSSEEDENLIELIKKQPSSMNPYFTKFIIALLEIFQTDNQLLEDRGSFIIRQLCILLNSEDIYRTLSEILQHQEDMKFISHMIQTLNTILLTSTELFELRNQLKELKTEESCSLFCCLYRSWCHNPVATVSLCLLTQNYKHACELLRLFGDLEVTVDFLTEIDKLIQLIESPIFTYLRLQLLDAPQNPYLVKSLYGLLMLLPQSEAFHTLRHRLSCVPNMPLTPVDNAPSSSSSPSLGSKSTKKDVKTRKIKFDELLKQFQTIQLKHKKSKQLSFLIDPDVMR
ncbi:Protein VAC14 [Nymphon striatum]|nr:Protein VAC14 [Nymphon striatum]